MIINITERVRQDVLDVLKTERTGQPEAYQVVFDDIIQRVRKMPIALVYLNTNGASGK